MGSWASNGSGHYWSDELYKIYGLDPQNGAPTVEQYLALVHPQDRASMAETIKMMHEQHCGFDVTKRIVRPDGEVRYVRCVGVPVVEQGVFKGFLGTSDGRHRAGAADAGVATGASIPRGSAKPDPYRQLGVQSRHTGKYFIHRTKTLACMASIPAKAPIPFERFYNTIHPEDEPAVRAKLESAIRAGTDYDVEYRICRPDGTIRFLRAIGHHNPSGEIGEYVGITMDITERKRAEEERERLRQLEADLAHINRVNMMGELAAALAHEIKQPIAASITSANACLRWLAHDPPDLERARAAATQN